MSQPWPLFATDKWVSDILDFQFSISDFGVRLVERLMIEISAIHIPHSAIGQEVTDTKHARLPAGRDTDTLFFY
jgi:hypothetical protein